MTQVTLPDVLEKIKSQAKAAVKQEQQSPRKRALFDSDGEHEAHAGATPTATSPRDKNETQAAATPEAEATTAKPYEPSVELPALKKPKVSPSGFRNPHVLNPLPFNLQENQLARNS